MRGRATGARPPDVASRFPGTATTLGVRARGRAPSDGPSPTPLSHILLTVPEMIWEITFGIYLVAKGFASPATRPDADPRPAPAPVPALG